MKKSHNQSSIDRRNRVKQAVKLYKKGIKMPKIAHELGISTSTVETYLSEEGISMLEKLPAPTQIKTIKKICLINKAHLLIYTIILICLVLIVLFF